MLANLRRQIPYAERKGAHRNERGALRRRPGGIKPETAIKKAFQDHLPEGLLVSNECRFFYGDVTVVRPDPFAGRAKAHNGLRSMMGSGFEYWFFNMGVSASTA